MFYSTFAYEQYVKDFVATFGDEDITILFNERYLEVRDTLKRLPEILAKLSVYCPYDIYCVKEEDQDYENETYFNYGFNGKYERKGMQFRFPEPTEYIENKASIEHENLIPVTMYVTIKEEVKLPQTVLDDIKVKKSYASLTNYMRNYDSPIFWDYFDPYKATITINKKG